MLNKCVNCILDTPSHFWEIGENPYELLFCGILYCQTVWRCSCASSPSTPNTSIYRLLNPNWMYRSGVFSCAIKHNKSYCNKINCSIYCTLHITFDPQWNETHFYFTEDLVSCAIKLIGCCHNLAGSCTATAACTWNHICKTKHLFYCSIYYILLHMKSHLEEVMAGSFPTRVGVHQLISGGRRSVVIMIKTMQITRR